MFMTLVLAGVGVTFGLWWYRIRTRPSHSKLHRAWSRVATSLGLELTGKKRAELELRGEVNGHPVVCSMNVSELDLNPFASVNDQTVLQLGLGNDFPSDFAALPAHHPMATDSDVELGDPDFDPAVSVHGQHRSILAVAGVNARRGLAEMATHDRHSDSGGIVVQARTAKLELRGLVSNPAKMEACIRRLEALGDMLFTRGNHIQRIIEHARVESNTSILAQQLWVLVKDAEQPSSSSRQGNGSHEVARKHLQHPDAMVRALAARCLGPEGYETLCTIASDENAPAESIAVAVLGLEPAPQSPQLEQAHSRALRQLAAFVHGGTLDRLQPMLDLETGLTRNELHGTMTDSANDTVCQALAIIGGLDAEEALIAALKHPNRRRAAAQALSEIGTVQSVPALAQWTQSAPIDYTCQSAIAAIQARVGPASSGGLSIVDAPAEGQLSVVSELGQISLSEPETS